MSKPSTTRSHWVDAARGLAIILVVIGHHVRGLSSAGIGENLTWAAVDSRLYAFHMPVFFALSGLFFLRSIENTTFMNFLQSRAIRLLYPMVLWTYLFIGMKVLAGPYTNSPAAVSDLLVSPFPGRLHLWFLWALFLISVVCFALRPFVTEGRLASGAILLVILTAMLGLQIPLTEKTAPWIAPALQNLPFFVTGILLGQPSWLGRQRPAVVAILAAAFLMLIAVWPVVETTSFVTIAKLFLTISFLFIAQSLWTHARGMTTQCLIVTGQASMAIYVLHTFFSAGTREILLIGGVTDAFTHFVLGVVIGVIGPLISLLVATRLGLEGVFGIRADGHSLTLRSSSTT